MLCRIPRTDSVFLVKGTAYFLSPALVPLKLLSAIPKCMLLKRCKTPLQKSMYEFQELLTNLGDVAVSSSDIVDDPLYGNDNITYRKARSEENIHTGLLSESWWLNPNFFHNQRHFLNESNSSTKEDSCTSDSMAYPPNWGPNTPYLMHIPMPPCVGWMPHGPQRFLVPQNVQHIQSRQYLRRTHSTESDNSKQNLDEISEILKVFSKRCWQDIAPPTPKKPRKKPSKKITFDFTLMSYNVLAQKLLDGHPYLYRNHNKRALTWQSRWKNLLNEIKTMRPDILCLQEVQEAHLKGYYSQIEALGYQSIYKKRTGQRCDGCAIYFKPDRLNLVRYETVEFFQPNVPILNRDNVAIIAKLCPRHSPKHEFIVATTHLLYNPKRQDVRLAQTQLLLTEVERMGFYWNSKSRKKYCPIIITGDFNSTPDSPVYKLINEGCLKYDHLAARKMDKAESPRHGNILVPSDLGITDDCQHAGLLQKRQKKDDMSRLEEAALIKLHHSDKTIAKISTEIIKNPELFSSGTLRHLFAFKSVYQHGTPSNPEGTTYQDKWLTVDYIFYSGKKHGDKVEDHRLKLASTYRLPLRDELGSMTIPNSLIGSDHLSLVAKFKLKL